MTTQMIDDLTYIAFEAIIFKKDRNIIKKIFEQCNTMEEFTQEIIKYLKTNNPFHILGIDTPASQIYWAALDNINFVELSQKISNYLNTSQRDLEDELPY